MNLDAILKTVEKPSRYIGNEYNSVHKALDDISIRFGFCFADVYEIGMSHLGMKILYHLLNTAENIYCERFFAPWVDMEEQMRVQKTFLCFRWKPKRLPKSSTFWDLRFSMK